METNLEKNKERIDNFFREDYCLGLEPRKAVEPNQPQKAVEIHQSKKQSQYVNELPYPEMYY